MKHDQFYDYQFALAIAEADADLGSGEGTAFYARWGKRMADISLCLLLTIPALPIFIAASFAAARSGGSVFYTQDRVGRNGRVYSCYKFRTMVPDAEARLERLCLADAALAQEWHRFQKLRNDPRVTPFGRFLRKTSLDELPQILNVLKGDMSIVGPRPFLVSQESLYREAGGRAYFDLRPGITGAWQVSARNVAEFSGRVAYDEAYSRRVSFRQDLRILLRTVTTVLRATGI